MEKSKTHSAVWNIIPSEYITIPHELNSILLIMFVIITEHQNILKILLDSVKLHTRVINFMVSHSRYLHSSVKVMTLKLIFGVEYKLLSIKCKMIIIMILLMSTRWVGTWSCILIWWNGPECKLEAITIPTTDPLVEYLRTQLIWKN